MTSTDDTFADLLSVPRTDLTVAADEFVTRVSSEYLYNHCVRSYLFARAVARAQGLTPGSDYDDELVYLSCILHDLGATDTANGNQRFEVDGADAAAAFLRDCGVDESRVGVVWNAVALHTSVGLAHRFGTVEAVSQVGIGTDVTGGFKNLLPAGFADLVHSRWPRYDLGYALSTAIADQVQANPAKGIPLSFPGLVHQEMFPSTPRIGWLDVVEASGWGDKPAPRSTGGEVADSPEELSAMFERHVGAADLDALVSLYDPAAVFAPSPGTLVSGHATIKKTLKQLIATNATLSLTPRRVQLLEDVALVTSHATVTKPDGEVGERATTEIMRRQHNGHWLYIYDDSHSAAY